MMGYTGTQPESQRFTLDECDEGKGVILSICFYEQNSYSVWKWHEDFEEYQVVEYNDWDSAIEAQAMVDGSTGCGQNRYVAIENTLQFYLSPGCLVKVEPRNIVLAKVRLEWSLDEFYGAGGTTMFIDRVGSVLGIHPSTIKIVSVLEGSVEIKLNVHAEFPEDEEGQLVDIKNRLDNLLASNSTIFGVPILDLETEGKGFTFTFPEANNTVIITEPTTEDSTPVIQSQPIRRLVIIAGALVGVCLIIVLVVCLVMRKQKKAVVIQVQEGAQEKDGKEGKNDELQLTQEYEQQYHPGQDLNGKKRNQEEEIVADDVKVQLDKEGDNEEWRHDWADVDTVRTNAQYNESNVLVNSPTGRSSVSPGREYNPKEVVPSQDTELEQI